MDNSRKQDLRWCELFALEEQAKHVEPRSQASFVSTPAKVAKAIGVSFPLFTTWSDDGCPGEEPYSLEAIANWHWATIVQPRLDDAQKWRQAATSSPRFAKTLDDVGAIFGTCKASVFKWIAAGAPECTRSGYDVLRIADWLVERDAQAAEAVAISIPDDSPSHVDTPAEVAVVFGVHEATARKWFAKGCPRSRGYNVKAIREWGLRNRSFDLVSHHNRQAIAEICEHGEAIVKRSPVMSDLDEDLIFLVMRRIQRSGRHSIDGLRLRLDLLDSLCNFCRQRFNHREVKLDDIPLTRRLRLEAAQPAGGYRVHSSDAIPEGFSKDALPMPLETLLKDYYIPERLVDGSEHTIRLLRVSISKLSTYLGRDAVLGDLRQGVVLDFLHFQLQGGANSPASVETHRERLLCLWRFAAKKRWLPDFPEIPAIRVPERVPDSWDREQMESLLTAAGKLDGYVGEIPAKLWWSTLFRTIYDTAERIGATLKIQFDDVSPDGWVTVAAETRKGKRRGKSFKLRAETLEGIEAIRKCAPKGSKVIFRWLQTPTYLYAKYGEILEAAGLPNNRRTKFHKIRRTTASEFEAAGGNASELLDHAHRSTTKKYLDPSVLKSVQPADLLPGIGEQWPEDKQPGNDELLDQIRKLMEASGK